MRVVIIMVAGLFFLWGIAAVSLAEVPRVINYQGYLTQSDGTPVPDGPYSIVFAIYDISSGGSALWNSGAQSVDVGNGMFSVQLGAQPMPAFPVNIVADSTRYLGITVGVDPEIAPRTRLTSSCFAFKAQSADTTRFAYNVSSLASSGFSYGLYSNLTNTGLGVTYGIWSQVNNQTTPASTFAMVGQLYSNATERRCVVGVSEAYDISTGYSYGIEGYARDGYAAYGGYFYGHAAGVNYGVYAKGSSYGVYGTCEVSNGNYGGYFYGNLHATGSNTKGGGGFIIDHPADPENRYLMHNDVESPDMKNVYDGIAILDNGGKAVIELPDYFEALNRDYRYQLTCIGDYARVYIAEEISKNRFMIAGGKPGMKISWQVTGIRKDAFAKAAKSDIEAFKAPEDRGHFLHPELFGFGMEKSINLRHHERDLEKANAEFHIEAR